MEEDPNLILIIKASTIETERAFSLPENANFYLPPRSIEVHSRDTTPLYPEDDDGTSNSWSCLRLTFDHLPHDMQLGYMFGTDRKACDVLLGRRGQAGISGRHFYITFDDQRRLILRDISKGGTAVSYNNQGATQNRRGFTWILFSGFEIQVLLAKNRSF